MTAAALALVGAALAHKPSFSADDYATPDAAFFVAEPEVSLVVYDEVSCAAPELWMVFPADPSVPLFVQLGVPVIERLRDHRPSVAVLAPGLPALEPGAVPFDVPDGLGGVVYETGDLAEEKYVFYEPFSQTESWIYVEDTVSLPESGLGYVVAWDPDQQTGKLWVATGTVEDFSDVDVEDFSSWLPQVQAYHETAEDMPEPPEEEARCAAPAAAEAPKGCSTAAGAPTGLVWLLVAALARRRQHRTLTLQSPGAP